MRSAGSGVGLIGFVLAALCCTGCAALTGGTRPAVLATSLQEILPHGDRDYFVYVWQALDGPQPPAGGVQVQHCSALADGEFEVTLSENGVALGRMRYVDDGQSVALRSEEDLAHGFRLSYDPPLPQVHVPLLAGSVESSASATMTRLADGLEIGRMPVIQVATVARGGTIRSRVGTYKRTVRFEMVRTLQSPVRSEQLKTESVLVPGIGEIQSTTSTPDVARVHRELACAIIGGRRVGQCANLYKLWER